MDFRPTTINGVYLISPHVFGDDRGFFMETWQARKFAEKGLNLNFVQENHSRSSQRVLRGLHYQIKQAQGKLVRVILGKVYDVAVDLRQSSPSFGSWFGATLSSENKHMLWIPPGFAHGFYVLSDMADLIYKCTEFYAPEHERTIRWDDEDLAIDWPLHDGLAPIVSEKDSLGKNFRDSQWYE